MFLILIDNVCSAADFGHVTKQYHNQKEEEDCGLTMRTCKKNLIVTMYQLCDNCN